MPSRQRASGTPHFGSYCGIDKVVGYLSKESGRVASTVDRSSVASLSLEVLSGTIALNLWLSNKRLRWWPGQVGLLAAQKISWYKTSCLLVNRRAAAKTQA
jgi:hypothetical protein